MSTIITRLFESNDQATAAVAELKRSAFGDDLVTVIGAKRQGAESLIATEVPRSIAAAVADGVRRGGTAVIVRAPYGYAVKATEILDRFNPSEIGVTDVATPTDSEAAPLSTALGLELLSDNPAPLSSWLGLRLLIRGPSTTQLIEKAAPFSQTLGFPLLANVSTSFGLPTLTSNPNATIFGNELTDVSTSFGFPQLSSNPAPMSSAMGMPVLIADE